MQSLELPWFFFFFRFGDLEPNSVKVKILVFICVFNG